MSVGGRHLRRGPGLAALAIAAASCAVQESPLVGDPPGELVILVDSDLCVPSELDQVEVAWLDPTGRRHERSLRLLGLGVDRLPDTISVTGAPGGSVLASAVGLLGGSVAVRRELRTTIPSGGRRALPLTLRRECTGVVCAAGLSCAVGLCAPEGVSPEELPRWPLDAGALDGGACPLDAAADVARRDVAGEASDDAPRDTVADLQAEARADSGADFEDNVAADVADSSLDAPDATVDGSLDVTPDVTPDVRPACFAGADCTLTAPRMTCPLRGRVDCSTGAAVCVPAGAETCTVTSASEQWRSGFPLGPYPECNSLDIVLRFTFGGAASGVRCAVAYAEGGRGFNDYGCSTHSYSPAECARCVGGEVRLVICCTCGSDDYLSQPGARDACFSGSVDPSRVIFRHVSRQACP